MLRLNKLIISRKKIWILHHVMTFSPQDKLTLQYKLLFFFFFYKVIMSGTAMFSLCLPLHLCSLSRCCISQESSTANMTFFSDMAKAAIMVMLSSSFELQCSWWLSTQMGNQSVSETTDSLLIVLPQLRTSFSFELWEQHWLYTAKNRAKTVIRNSFSSLATHGIVCALTVLSPIKLDILF